MSKHKNASFFLQFQVYFKKFIRGFFSDKQWKYLIFAIGISFIICLVIKNGMFTTYEKTQSGIFTIISGAIWIGIFNSIQSVCKEHDIIRYEYNSSSLNLTAYVIARVMVDFILCLLQTIIILLCCYLFVDFPENGILLPAIIEYFITLFLVLWGADILGMMVSSVSKDSNVAMTAMPLVLIIQLIMSGVLFELDEISEKIANITLSKWGMSAFGSIADLNGPQLPLTMSSIYPEIVKIPSEAGYDHISANLEKSWVCLLVISLVCIFICILSLKIKNRKK